MRSVLARRLRAWAKQRIIMGLRRAKAMPTPPQHMAQQTAMVAGHFEDNETRLAIERDNNLLKRSRFAGQPAKPVCGRIEDVEH